MQWAFEKQTLLALPLARLNTWTSMSASGCSILVQSKKEVGPFWLPLTPTKSSRASSESPATSNVLLCTDACDSIHSNSVQFQLNQKRCPVYRCIWFNSFKFNSSPDIPPHIAQHAQVLRDEDGDGASWQHYSCKALMLRQRQPLAVEDTRIIRQASWAIYLSKYTAASWRCRGINKGCTSGSPRLGAGSNWRKFFFIASLTSIIAAILPTPKTPSKHAKEL